MSWPEPASWHFILPLAPTLPSHGNCLMLSLMMSIMSWLPILVMMPPAGHWWCSLSQYVSTPKAHEPYSTSWWWPDDSKFQEPPPAMLAAICWQSEMKGEPSVVWDSYVLSPQSLMLSPL
ncbi:hypothetical protein B0T16DRAFT_400643 [Cercophora newfieldiana]|uniref:Uncharacterized protein n=1 Tax=Cercophora newfieldiana TaxID=92897 RepID=A0AA39YS67_9PEZI|nr:hypothetical protein B0T16DRAFT_400643 [Cercophora newfieldiana]